ncbi:MAG: glucose-1-phosphate thymidylyltransferase RfbA [Chlamydiia bacterium]|nr:glucose-1-phosphate thymidylyltransferase RfbA [Chlamydiia bacterium]MCP5509051.1 glucose-1-phosphate thymidylyltransferase RfbA [Chlamydiales bacterium]
MKGIILAGGTGSRLFPVTFATCKQLLPIYDKPMIYFPLAVLMQAHIRDILIICCPKDIPRFQDLLSDGSHLGLTISYAAQPEANGIAESFLIAEHFIANSPVALVLGDNLFYGHNIAEILAPCRHHVDGATVFGYEVQDPERYGVVEFDDNQQVKNIIEKPHNPTSSYAVTGLYFYDENVVNIAKKLKPSPRGELEITDVNKIYLAQKKLKVILLERGFAWLDSGTHAALSQASTYVQTIQERQGIQIACVEEIAFKQKFIDHAQLATLAGLHASSAYGQYLQKLVQRSATTLAELT